MQEYVFQCSACMIVVIVQFMREIELLTRQILNVKLRAFKINKSLTVIILNQYFGYLEPYSTVFSILYVNY